MRRGLARQDVQGQNAGLVVANLHTTMPARITVDITGKAEPRNLLADGSHLQQGGSPFAQNGSPKKQAGRD